MHLNEGPLSSSPLSSSFLSHLLSSPLSSPTDFLEQKRSIVAASPASKGSSDSRVVIVTGRGNHVLPDVRRALPVDDGQGTTCYLSRDGPKLGG